MKAYLFLFLLTATISLWSCKEEVYTDPNYPTQVTALSSNELSQLADQLAQTPMYKYTVLDTFGIPFLVDKYKDSLNTKDWRFSASYEELSQMTKEAVVEYGYFLNVTDSSKVSIRSISTTGNDKYNYFLQTYPDSLPPVWKVTTNEQIYDSVSIRGTSLTLILSPSGLVGCSGHWYSEVYFPDTMTYSMEAAKELIMDKRLTHGRTEITPNEETSWHKAREVVLPLRKETHIELHVCWALYPDAWEVLIDSENGEILSAINTDNL